MIPKAYKFRKAYGRLKMPVVIIAGREDRLIEAEQSAELFRKACKFLWDRPRAEDLAKKKRPYQSAKNRRYRVA
jgi:hypothetical protein